MTIMWYCTFVEIWSESLKVDHFSKIDFIFSRLSIQWLHSNRVLAIDIIKHRVSVCPPFFGNSRGTKKTVWTFSQSLC